ncbi:MAG TPA: ferritin-like domain-containing protein, partial [Verrucomicrobiae bacterium]|nr:ferritin-like domain-containing protein [Verrucomicrobiae bacterium]
LRAIPIWTMALEVEINAGKMLYGFAATEPDPLVRKALELQAFEEDRHGRLLSTMIARYGLNATPGEAKDPPTREAFIDFGYNECVDSFAGFGIFKLACDARIFPDALTAIFTRVLVEEARHIVFFVNWVAYDRYRRGYGAPLAQWLPALMGYGSATWRRVKEGAKVGEGDENATLDLFGDIMDGLTPAKFVRTCITENQRYMRDFDPRLLRPRVIPAIASFALALIELIDRLRAFLQGPGSAPKATPGDA